MSVIFTPISRGKNIPSHSPEQSAPTAGFYAKNCAIVREYMFSST